MEGRLTRSSLEELGRFYGLIPFSIAYWPLLTPKRPGPGRLGFGLGGTRVVGGGGLGGPG